MVATTHKEPVELLAEAQRAGLKYRAFAGKPARLFIWGPRNDETDRIAAELYARRDEVVALMPQHPSPANGESDSHIMAGDIPLDVLRSMVIAWVHETIAVIEAEQLWEQERQP
jgi:hypothetical protein